MRCEVYSPQYKDVWNATVLRSRNATFLHLREYMDYHADRFCDASLLFFNDKGKCLACLPATSHTDNAEICSHSGLTYGGLLLTPEATTSIVSEILSLAGKHYKSLGYKELVYKAIPHIYHSIPAEEDLYWIFRAGGQLIARSVSSTIPLHHPLPLSKLRRRKTNHAIAHGFSTNLGQPSSCEDWEDYWKILHVVLSERHATIPVHNCEEIRLLHQRFPDKIRLFTVKNSQSSIVAGCVMFETQTTAHVQYIAANASGRDGGALDLLFSELIEHYQHQGKAYFDFGISTEQGGNSLNEGLIFQKEGFGGRAVCYDTYKVELNQLIALAE